MGKDALGNLQYAVWAMREAGQITAHEVRIAHELAYVLTGGDGPPRAGDRDGHSRSRARGVPAAAGDEGNAGTNGATRSNGQAAEELARRRLGVTAPCASVHRRNGG